MSYFEIVVLIIVGALDALFLHSMFAFVFGYPSPLRKVYRKTFRKSMLQSDFGCVLLVLVLLPVLASFYAYGRAYVPCLFTMAILAIASMWLYLVKLNTRVKWPTILRVVETGSQYGIKFFDDKYPELVLTDREKVLAFMYLSDIGLKRIGAECQEYDARLYEVVLESVAYARLTGMIIDGEFDRASVIQWKPFSEPEMVEAFFRVSGVKGSEHVYQPEFARAVKTFY